MSNRIFNCFVLSAQKEFAKEDLVKLLDEPYFVPEGTPLSTQLVQFQKGRKRFALVVDEYGDIQGIVTLEDILEELIGEIGDSDLQDMAEPQQLREGAWLIDANTGVRGWAAATGLVLDNCPAATMGGLIAAKLGKIPAVGDTIELGNLSLEVSSMNEYRVATVTVSIQKNGVRP